MPTTEGKTTRANRDNANNMNIELKEQDKGTVKVVLAPPLDDLDAATQIALDAADRDRDAGDFTEQIHALDGVRMSQEDYMADWWRRPPGGAQSKQPSSGPAALHPAVALRSTAARLGCSASCSDQQ